MELWTEYEGITIDGAFPLNKLLLPEGRSAFFSTENGKDDPRLIRLIACHFDEAEILARWRGVEALGHPNFIKLERSGQLTLDKVTVIYAVLERVDANLAQVLAERRLTVSEATQLAVSVASALEALHVHGFVHEHIAPENVFAVGEAVKVRSDCIREAPEGEKGLEAKGRDVHDLAVLLLEALTQARTLDVAISKGTLPAPFDQIVRNGLSGTWGIGEIRAALEDEEKSSAPSPANGSSSMRNGHHSPVAAAARSAASSAPAELKAKSTHVAASAERPPLRIEQVLRDPTQRTKWMGAVAFAACVLAIALWLGWHFFHAGSAHEAGHSAAAPAATLAAVADHAASPAGAEASALGAASTPARKNAGERAQWRVIAYTYHRQDQAQKKVKSLAQQHPELRPAVFAPTQRAPYLVTIGGVMSRDQAYALARQSRSAGLPRDTYAQNYSGK